MRRCPACEQIGIHEVNDIIMDVKGLVEEMSGYRCTVCKEEFPNPRQLELYIEHARSKGIWPEPLKIYRNLSRSGKSLVLRIPKDLERQLHLTEETEVTITRSGPRIIVDVANEKDDMNEVSGLNTAIASESVMKKNWMNKEEHKA